MLVERAGGVVLGGHLVGINKECLGGVHDDIIVELAIFLFIKLLELLLLCWVEAQDVGDGHGRGCRREQDGEEATAHLVAIQLEARGDARDGGGEVVAEGGVHFGGWRGQTGYPLSPEIPFSKTETLTQRTRECLQDTKCPAT